MGYICPRCGEEVPGDTFSPCTTSPGGGTVGVAPRFRALTREIDDTSSPVRQFLGERFTCGLKDLQRRFRQAAPPLAVPPVPQAEANPGTAGGAVDWLLQFMACPHPGADLAMVGAGRYLGPRMMRATADLAALLGAALRPYPGPVATPDPCDAAALMEVNDLIAPVGTAPAGPAAFTGPLPGSDVDAELLARGCWALALLTEAFRSMQAAATGPLSRFQGRTVTADDLLALAPSAGLDQLARFREVFQSALLPQLASRTGPWTLGPAFAGSALIGGADGDLIAAGLLLELKTSAKLTLAVKDLFQVIGYALLDFDDEYKLTELGIFSARYAYLAPWDIARLLNDLAGHQVSLPSTRQEFRQLLLTHQSQPR
jgi:hypothetical protein